MAYLGLPERPAICAGDSYPAEKSELSESLTKLFASAPTDKFAGLSKAIVAPHLDLRLGGELDYAYAAAYHSIRKSEADVYVILGTSHLISNDYFMFTEKPYETPLGQATLDLELLHALDDELGDYMTIDDLAHKNEHSIEYQVLLLQHYFKPDVTILPILCGSLYDELESDDVAVSSVRYNKIIDGVKTALNKLNKKAVFIASADLAHIGRKFGDDFDADTKLEELEKADLTTINSLIADSDKGFLGSLFACNDQWKVCGMAPITALAKICDYEKAELLHYNIWDQTETKSAVSFASLAFN
jgi:AmmeMemoRadiSam system protein B